MRRLYSLLLLLLWAVVVNFYPVFAELPREALLMVFKNKDKSNPILISLKKSHWYPNDYFGDTFELYSAMDGSTLIGQWEIIKDTVILIPEASIILADGKIDISENSNFQIENGNNNASSIILKYLIDDKGKNLKEVIDYTQTWTDTLTTPQIRRLEFELIYELKNSN